MAVNVQSIYAVRRVAVVGAGAGGLAAAKYLRAENHFSAIHVYEQRSTIGGLWNHSAETTGDGLFSVPQTSSHCGHEKPAAGHDQTGFVFVSPVYDRLEVNIPRQLMQFSDHEFSSHLPLFPGHRQVLDYLCEYGRDISGMIQLTTRVVKVQLKSSRGENDTAPESKEIWTVESENLATGEHQSEDYDAVIVANGHYAVPYVPTIPGLVDWNKEYPGSITHSKYYRTPDDFRGKSMLVVGSNASGLDISSQVATVSKGPVYLSQKSVSEMAAGFKVNTRIQHKGQIIRVEPNEKNVIFQDNSVAKGVDEIIFCTGYFYSYPFLNNVQPHVTDEGNMVIGTFEHLFSSAHPTLAFLGLPQKVIPFPLSEMQAAVVARVYSGRLSIPSSESMATWEKELLQKCGTADEFHTLGFPKDANYMDMLVDWAAKADHRETLENGGQGKMPRKWNLKERWIREQIPKMRKAFSEKTEGRLGIKTVEHLGFHFKREEVGELHSSQYP